MRPMLFDLETDPDELIDLGTNPDYTQELERLKEAHFDWTRQHHNRITMNAGTIEKMTDAREPPGIYIAYANREELEEDGLQMPSHADR